MKKLVLTCVLGLAVAGSLVGACADYSNPQKPAPAGTPAATTTATGSAPSPIFQAPPDGGGNACQIHAYRGGTPGAVICPGASNCECPQPGICCMQAVDSNSGTCQALANCRHIAIQCDGSEDCNGGVCCMEDRAGGGTSCKAAADCTGRWLCRSDNDCKGAPLGPHCSPADFGTQGVDDRGLDGLIGFCGQ